MALLKESDMIENGPEVCGGSGKVNLGPRCKVGRHHKKWGDDVPSITKASRDADKKNCALR